MGGGKRPLSTTPGLVVIYWHRERGIDHSLNQEISLKSHKGHVLVLDFKASLSTTSPFVLTASVEKIQRLGCLLWAFLNPNFKAREGLRGD